MEFIFYAVNVFVAWIGNIPLQLTQLSLDHLLVRLGILVFVLGTVVTIFSKAYTRKTPIKSKESSEHVIPGKGNPIIISEFYVPCPATLKVKFRKKTGPEVIFKLVKKVEINHSTHTEQHEFFYGEKKCNGGKFRLMLDPNATYLLEAESNIEGVNDKGLAKMVEILKKCTDVEENDIVTKRINSGRIGHPIKQLIVRFQPTLFTELRGQTLKNVLIHNAKNTPYEKILRDCYSDCPTIFDEIADVVYSHSSGKATTIGNIEYNLIKVERPYGWLFNVGLTLVTSSIVILLTGLK